MLDKHSDGTYAVLSLAARCESLAERPEGALFAAVRRRSFAPRPGAVDRARQRRRRRRWSSAPNRPSSRSRWQPPGAWQTLRQYVVDGIWHIWIGFDHILFLLALLLPAVLVRRDERWEAVPRLRRRRHGGLKVVTAFTLAHSITLSLAALQVISLPSRLVESAIAASVVAGGAEQPARHHRAQPLGDGLRASA